MGPFFVHVFDGLNSLVPPSADSQTERTLRATTMVAKNFIWCRLSCCVGMVRLIGKQTPDAGKRAKEEKNYGAMVRRVEGTREEDGPIHSIG